MTERWLPVTGWEGWYEVSDEGRVRSVPRTIMRLNRWGDVRPFKFQGRVLALRPDPHGHMRVTLSRPGFKEERMVHHMVLEEFIGPRPDGLNGLHWDDDRSNNRLDNLRWGSLQENQLDRVRNGHHNHAHKTHCVNGHEFTPENTYQRSPKHPHWRGCRKCLRINRARWEASRKAVAA